MRCIRISVVCAACALLGCATPGRLQVDWVDLVPSLGEDRHLHRLLIHLDLPDDARLETVALDFFDSSVSGDESVGLLLYSSGPLCCRAREVSTPGTRDGRRWTFTLDVPPWRVGGNRVRARALFHHEGRTRPKVSSATVVHELPAPTFGLAAGADGRRGTAFEVPGLPIFASDCGFDVCMDADGDGLLDTWESFATEVLRPSVALDEDDRFFENAGHRIRTFTRVRPVENVLFFERYILFHNIFAFTKDYGTDVGPFAEFDSHNGDTEDWWTLWRVTSRHRIELVQVGGHHHYCVLALWSCRDLAPWTERDVTLADDGRMIVFVEEDKHGLWPSRRMCNDLADYDCHADLPRTLLHPPAVNVGEPPDDGRSLIDRLGSRPTEGAHPYELFVFPGEAIWSPTHPHDGRLYFCGGLGWDGSCAVHIGTKLRREIADTRSLPDDDSRPLVVVR